MLYLHFLTLEEMQLNVRFHFTPFRKDIQNNLQQMWHKRGKGGTLINCLWECKLVQPLYE